MIGGTAGAVEIVLGTVVLGWAVALCVSDIRSRRVPDRLTVPAIPVVWAAAALSAPAALLGGLGWSLLYLLMALWRAGIGGGDIKLAASLGVLVAWAGGPAGLLLAIAGASLISLAVALARRRRSVAHAPAMLLGSLLGGVIGATVG